MLSSDCSRPGFILDFETFPRHRLSCNVKMIVWDRFRFGFFTYLVYSLFALSRNQKDVAIT